MLLGCVSCLCNTDDTDLTLMEGSNFSTCTKKNAEIFCNKKNAIYFCNIIIAENEIKYRKDRNWREFLS